MVWTVHLAVSHPTLQLLNLRLDTGVIRLDDMIVRNQGTIVGHRAIDTVVRCHAIDTVVKSIAAIGSRWSFANRSRKSRTVKRWTRNDGIKRIHNSTGWVVSRVSFCPSLLEGLARPLRRQTLVWYIRTAGTMGLRWGKEGMRRTEVFNQSNRSWLVAFVGFVAWVVVIQALWAQSSSWVLTTCVPGPTIINTLPQ